MRQLSIGQIGSISPESDQGSNVSIWNSTDESPSRRGTDPLSGDAGAVHGHVRSMLKKISALRSDLAVVTGRLADCESALSLEKEINESLTEQVCFVMCQCVSSFCLEIHPCSLCVYFVAVRLGLKRVRSSSLPNKNDGSFWV